MDLEDRQLNMKFKHRESKQAIREAARKHKTTMTGLVWRGLIEMEPTLKDVYLRER